MSAKLLAIDNNSDVRHLLEIRLKKAGYQVISADNVNDKFVQQAGGWNKMMVDTELKDHNFKSIARPDPIKHNMSVLDCCGQIVLPRTPRTPPVGHHCQSTCMRKSHPLTTCALLAHPHVVLV